MTIQLAQYWGWFMNSQPNAEAFRDVLLSAHELHPEGISYLEIGLGNCGTINAVDYMLDQIPGTHSIVGIEVESWTQKYLTPYRSSIFIGGREVIPQWQYDVVLIDACHCKECVMKDFEAVEGLVTQGGFVLFHDTDEAVQGIHKDTCENPHQVNGIETLAALDEINFTGWESFRKTDGKVEQWHGLHVYRKL